MQETRDLRADIERLGLTQSGLARIMQQLGDDRDHHNILRHIPRVVMRLLEERMTNTPVRKIRQGKRAESPPTHAAESPAPQNP